MKRLAYLFMLLAVAAVLLPSCKKEKKYKIGVSQCSEDDWRTKMNDEINREIMFHEDAEVEIRSADDDSERQISDIRYFADNGFDIIIVSPNEAAALTPVIEEVYRSGIPVIVFDRDIIGDSYTTHIGADNAVLGQYAANYALSMLKDNTRAIEISGLRGSTPAEDRHKGFAATFESGGGTILGSGSGKWNQRDAERVTDSMLTLYPQTDLIYAHNDRMAIGASKVARRRGRPDIRIIGIDASPQIGLKAVADSVIDATFLYPTEGNLIIQTAIDILNGKKVEKEIKLPSTSAVDISNADILLFQDQAFKSETDNMKKLKERIDSYWEKHSSQTKLFYSSIAILLLLSGICFLLLRAFIIRTRHQKELLAQKRLLEEERDKQKRLNEQLDAATRSKLAFFTNVSHDLRTPLTLIAEPVAQLSEASNLTPAQHMLTRIAGKNIKILQRLINQILDFRKYENGKLDLHLTETDFDNAIREWMEAFYTVARKRDIKLRLVAPDDHDGQRFMLAVDVGKIERVFFNLLSNAFKFTPANGEITVEWTHSEDELILKVADTGEGIAEKDLENVFERFYQADRIQPEGSGIGLSVSKAFVELHGGSIKVESCLKKGSVFTVTIPVRHVDRTDAGPLKAMDVETVEKEPDEIEQHVDNDSDKPLLLVIDDNQDIRHLVGELLKDDYSIITASNGREGLRRAAKYVPDLIVCDVMMPVMDGMECCRRIKEEVSTSHIPVLLLTACSLDEQRAEGYESGADGYLSKPFDSRVLKARCASLIANRKRIMDLWNTRNLKDKAAASRAVPTSDIDDEFYNRFLEIFKKEIGNADLSVDKLASMMGLERTQLYRKIKSLTNYAPVELMRRLRLQEGRRLLIATDKSISEIAYAIGFSTPAYFSKCYREAYGLTPTEQRNS